MTAINWVQIYTTLDASLAEALEEGLMAAGASAVTMMDAADQPILEPALGTTPLWADTTVIGLFNAEEDIEAAKTLALNVFQSIHPEAAISLQSELLENEDWTRKWIENFKPIQFGERLWVCPSWCEAPDANAINLKLDPGLAFGTGTHPTTFLCLAWLDANDVKDKIVIDYGCGSGILGIAALLLGAKHVYAIDNDPQALLATQDNAERNDIAPEQITTLLPEQVGELKGQLLLANILAQPLRELRDQMLALLEPGSELVLSGILADQAPALSDHYSARADMEPATQQGDWIRLNGRLLQ